MKKFVHEQETHLCYINREKDKSAAHYCSDISTAISTELVALKKKNKKIFDVSLLRKN